MQFIKTIDELESHYGKPSKPALIKVCDRLTPGYRAWIMRSKLCILSSVGPEGTDASPRGDEGPVVTEIDDETLAMPDWHGNNRIDSLKNIVRDERISLMFFIHGSNNVIRINGRAKITTDTDFLEKFRRGKHIPRSVIIIKISEIYAQCARALMRSGFWTDRPQHGELPTIGQLLKEITNGDFDGKSYDEDWPERAAKTMW